jgi:hypothetical protein
LETAPGQYFDLYAPLSRKNAVRSKGCLTPAAFLLVIGGFTLACGLESNSSQVAWAGASFLGMALLAGLTALFFRWQGWD